MLKSFLEFIITYEESVISCLISLIALLLSLYNFFKDAFCKRTKIKIMIYNTTYIQNTYQFFVVFQNCSQLPISISSVSINKSNYCVIEPTIIKESTKKVGKEIISRTELKTIAFPINLNSLESKSGYLEFRNVNKIDVSDITFDLYTNRKKVSKLKPKFNHDDASK